MPYSDERMTTQRLCNARAKGVTDCNRLLRLAFAQKRLERLHLRVARP